MEGDYQMGFITWIIVGAIAGWLAGKVVKGRGFGLLGNIIVGVVGALLGGWIANSLLGIGGANSGFNLPTLAIAFGGSVVLLFILKLFKK
jgi:uncharacterized membrane protein YeaQ/YmgE (transglycosylase-associated protein family)